MSLLTQTKEVLAKNKIRPNKRLGQHFLINEGILQQIILAAKLSKNDVVLEIGAGIGVLTAQLVPLVSKIIAIEIDPTLINVLRQELAGYTNVLLIKDDILKVNLAGLGEQTSPKIKVIANLPYYIVTPVIMHLLEAKEKFSTLILMVQKEVGNRIMAQPGSKTYGALSVWVQYHAQVERICEVSNQYFFPQPKVDSVVLKLKGLDSPAISVQEEQLFFKVVRAAFSKRRKILINTLTSLGISKDKLNNALLESGIDLKRRGETLSLEEFGRISNALSKKH